MVPTNLTPNDITREWERGGYRQVTATVRYGTRPTKINWKKQAIAHRVYRRQDSQEEQIPYSVLSLSRFRSLPPFFSLALFFVCTGTNVIRNTSIFKK